MLRMFVFFPGIWHVVYLWFAVLVWCLHVSCEQKCFDKFSRFGRGKWREKIGVWKKMSMCMQTWPRAIIATYPS